MKWPIKLNMLLLDRGRISMARIAGELLWIAWLASIGLGPGHLDLSKHVIGADYLEYYSAGMAVRLGETDKLYDVAYLNDLEHSIAGPFEGHYLFVTPPLYALLYVPLSLLPYEISFLTWCVFGLFCLWISISLLRSSNTTHHFLWALTFFQYDTLTLS
ncbi:hypothetical protein SBDP1_420035 [Syntrophobacter sp. SbD1]|nr:hypothetical protein SBDP1_420035 [Syntrophobacter sp. SbD1]